MPTPVSTARQCLTEEAARALDDAVAVARRRNHAQTTSLHAISALLALPSSTLRDACTRARSCSYAPRLQFRALELSVGVSLDRLPTSKSVEDDPPVSNSLMAAIKRSQANQRRHPESFHLLQMQAQLNQAASFLKVELKHFILSILDDPIVSRVFGEAGFRSCDIKLALLQPPVVQASRFSRNRCPPIFLCNLPAETSRPGFNFPFMGRPVNEVGDENCRRIGEVLARKTKKNPLLMGAYARTALQSFIESVQGGRGAVLPAEIAGLSVVCIDKDIAEFIAEGGSEEKMGLKFKDLGSAVQQCSGPGIVVSFGELDVFVRDGGSASAALNFVVSELTSLLEIHGGKLWLVGVAANSDIYSKFLALFPKAEKDWDLQPLPITSAAPAVEGLYPKSSLLGSFVPFGGFFPTPSEFKSPISSTSETFSLCRTCNEKYEQEVADTLKIGPTSLVSSYSTSLPLLQKVNANADKGLDVVKTNEEQTSSDAKILGLQKKWSDICQCLHQAQSSPEFDISQARSQVPSVEGFQYGSVFKESSSQDPTFYKIQYANQSPYMDNEFQSIYPSRHILKVPVSTDTISVNAASDQITKVSNSQQTDVQSPWLATSALANKSQLDRTSSSSLTSVTTALGLGSLYTSAAHEPNTPKLWEQKGVLQRLSDSLSTDLDAVHDSLHQIAQSSSCSGPNLEWKFDSIDFKSLVRLLSEKVGWQDEAIYVISQTLRLCRSGAGKHRGSRVRGDIWLAFLGPDRVGKKKIASAIAEIIFGKAENLISVDLSFQDRVYSLHSMFDCQNSYCYDVLRRKTVADYIAGELSKKPHSVVLLENVDKADFLVQTSLFQAIRTGKFPDSHGREININNTIFIVTSTLSEGSGSFPLDKEANMFCEDRILEARRSQMQILPGHISGDAKIVGGANVRIAQREGTSVPAFLNKRKLVESSDFKQQATCKVQKHTPEASRSCLDLNMPLVAVEEDIDLNQSESLAENQVAWLSDFWGEVDGKVAFKPFNFDALTGKILTYIGVYFQRTFGSEILLEIDYEVMVQILAAAWLTEKKNGVEDWVEHVLSRSFKEAQQKYQPETENAIKLISCENIFEEEQDPGVCLPGRINLN